MVEACQHGAWAGSLVVQGGYLHAGRAQGGDSPSAQINAPVLSADCMARLCVAVTIEVARLTVQSATPNHAQNCAPPPPLLI